MIRFRLGEILASKRITATKIHEDTKIAKSTISTMVNNRSEMIRLSTINDLCMYLDIKPGDLFDFSPYNFKFDVNFVLEKNPYIGKEFTTFVRARISAERKGLLDYEDYYGPFMLKDIPGPIDPEDYIGSDEEIVIFLNQIIKGPFESEEDYVQTLMLLEEAEIRYPSILHEEIVNELKEKIKSEAIERYRMKDRKSVV